MQRDLKTGLILGVAALIIVLVIWGQYSDSETKVLIQPPTPTGIPASAYIGDPVAPEPARVSTSPAVIIHTIPQPVEPAPAVEAATAAIVSTPPPSAPAPAAAPATATPVGARYHITREGERLWNLAEKYYGQGKGWRWTTIREANKDIIPENGMLKPDLKLVIPPDSAQPTPLVVSPSTTPQTSTPRPRQERTHIVAKGDTLSTLAEKYLGDKKLWTRIHKANENLLADPNKLPLGAELVIPPKS